MALTNIETLQRFSYFIAKLNMKRKIPPLNALKAFEAAGRHEHFSKAGDELLVSHAAISRHVKELEQWLGIKLFKRTGRGVELTDIGTQYLSGLTPIFDNILAVTKAASETKYENVLNVTADSALAFQWLIQKLKGFSETYPKMKVSIDPSAEIVDIKTSDFDLGIRFGYGQWEGVEAHEIYRPSIFPVCSPEYLRTSNLSKPEDLATAELLHDDSSLFWKDWLKNIGIRRNRRASEASFEKFLTLAAAESGLGVALSDELLCIEAIKKGSLVIPLSTSVPSNKSYYLVYSIGKGDCESVQKFAKWLSSEVKKSLAEFEYLVQNSRHD